MNVTLEFDGKVFCFTGTLLQLKRTQAERETRARGGVAVSDVNDRLDYLVVGSKASLGWKFGNYGTKIAAARELAEPVRVSKECRAVRCQAAGPTKCSKS